MSYINKKGFTLVEILVVLVIVGILASFGYPAYKDYVLEAQRQEAVQAIQEVQITIAEYLLINDSLVGRSSIDVGLDNNKLSSNLYSLSVTFNGDSEDNYSVVATPKADSPQANDICKSITYSSKTGLFLCYDSSNTVLDGEI